MLSGFSGMWQAAVFAPKGRKRRVGTIVYPVFHLNGLVMHVLYLYEIGSLLKPSPGNETQDIAIGHIRVHIILFHCVTFSFWFKNSHVYQRNRAKHIQIHVGKSICTVVPPSKNVNGISNPYRTYQLVWTHTNTFVGIPNKEFGGHCSTFSVSLFYHNYFTYIVWSICLL